MFQPLKKFCSIPEQAVTRAKDTCVNHASTIATTIFMGGEFALIAGGAVDFTKWYLAISGGIWFALDVAILASRGNPRVMSVVHALSPPTMVLTNYASLASGNLVSIANLGLYSSSRFFGALAEISRIKSFPASSCLAKLSKNAATKMWATGTAARLSMIAVETFSQHEYLVASVLSTWLVADGFLVLNATKKRPAVTNSRTLNSKPMP